MTMSGLCIGRPRPLSSVGPSRPLIRDTPTSPPSLRGIHHLLLRQRLLIVRRALQLRQNVLEEHLLHLVEGRVERRHDRLRPWQWQTKASSWPYRFKGRPCSDRGKSRRRNGQSWCRIVRPVGLRCCRMASGLSRARSESALCRLQGAPLVTAMPMWRLIRQVKPLVVMPTVTHDTP